MNLNQWCPTILTIHPVDGETFHDSDDKHAETGAVPIHELQHVHATLWEETELMHIFRQQRGRTPNKNNKFKQFSLSYLNVLI